ncbi:MAG: bifunctional adenosylcobinamide kinase/adenosylcobinamide-phosphate guanylyltransferase [Eubacteriales bacterium]|nr:bifunctional adenosylcobinamide kinase/adenosylcobinamide-phosphate guanylyltransferase [Eubacteriales bacterium]
MILITGGAYQGKLDYAKEILGAGDEDVFTCGADDMRIDFDKKIIDGVDQFVLACVRAGADPEAEAAKVLPLLQDKVVTCTDISQGVVPMDKTERAWREGTGRFVTALGRHADKVVRMFCGIPEVVKDTAKA